MVVDVMSGVTSFPVLFVPAVGLSAPPPVEQAERTAAISIADTNFR